MMFAIPAILLALIVVAALGAGWLNSAIAIGVGYIPIFVRVVRDRCWPFASPATFPRAECSGSPAAGSCSGTSSQCVRNPRRSDEPRPRVVRARGGEPQLPRSGARRPRPPRSGDGEPGRQFGRDRPGGTLAFPSVAIIVAVIGFNLLGDGLRGRDRPLARGNDDARAMPISDRGPAMRVIGMISGTSFDAVEAVLADFLQETRCSSVISSPIGRPLPRSSPGPYCRSSSARLDEHR